MGEIMRSIRLMWSGCMSNDRPVLTMVGWVDWVDELLVPLLVLRLSGSRHRGSNGTLIMLCT